LFVFEKGGAWKEGEGQGNNHLWGAVNVHESASTWEGKYEVQTAKANNTVLVDLLLPGTPAVYAAIETVAKPNGMGI